MGSKFVRNKNGEIVGMIQDLDEDIRNLNSPSGGSDDFEPYDAEWARQHTPIRYWLDKIWKVSLVLFLIVIPMLCLFIGKEQLAGWIFLGSVIAVIVIMALVKGAPLVLGLIAIYLEILCLPFLPFVLIWEKIKSKKKK